MNNEYIPRPLPVTGDLPGMSRASLTEHQKLYEGYVKKTNELRQKIVVADLAAAGAVWSEVGEMKRQETFAINGMKLHELYFSLLGGNGELSGDMRALVERDFGSVEAWKADFVATGMSARGWAILAYDLADRALRNFAMDAQNVGAVWAAVPLVAMDVYEHAYFMDHGTNRKAYIEAFLGGLNWGVANALLAKISR